MDKSVFIKKNKFSVRKIITFRSVAMMVSVLGISVSSYALYNHYGSAGSSFCNLSEAVSCDAVNKGPWSEIGGVPVAFIGIVGYVFSLALVFFRPNGWTRWLFFGSLAGLLFSVYLTYLEAFVISAWCPICLFSFLLVAILTFISFSLFRRHY